MNGTGSWREKDWWRNAFIYALLTTVLVTGTVFTVAGVLGKANQKLAERVDQNTAAIVCILRLGVGDNDPPRSTENVNLCLADPSWVDGPNVSVKP